ncbi:MAG: flagellar FlbD family protein [Negativicutes bacterium]|nr:flagellar FlbD family protein [Negativicutes bacterium]
MIRVTRFKAQDHEMIINADLIETIEETPDTVITLTTGKKLIVEETADEIVRRVVEYKRALNRGARI